MTFSRALSRHTVALSLMTTLMAAMVPDHAYAVPAVSQVYLRPHCEEPKQEQCSGFTVKDPESLVTPPLKVGDEIDMDLVLKNEANAGIERIRAWIAYDPAVLEGIAVTPSAAFPVITPDELGFDSGYAKIQATTRSGKASGPVIPLARIRFRVISVAPAYATILSFYDVKEGTDGHTFVTIAKTGDSGNLLAAKQNTLFIPMQPGTGSTSSSVTSTASQASSHASVAGGVSSSAAVVSSATSTDSSTSSASSLSAQDQAVFTLLQPQNLRVTTDGGTVYLAWDALRSGSLAGYNLYYGTRSGEYLQRRAMPAAQTNLILRNMPVDTTYYFALRGVNGSGEESAFSQEVAVKVGSPHTSTNPLLGTGVPATGKNPLTGTGGTKTTVPGATGLPPAGLLILLVSAGIGTLFALRRQLTSHA